MTEPREWALADGYVPQRLDSMWCFDDAETYFQQYELVNPTHVIEYSAYQELQEKLKVAEEALEFYGDLKSYFMNDRMEDFRNQISDKDLEQILNHYSNYEQLEWIGGKKAREALAKIRVSDGV